MRPRSERYRYFRNSGFSARVERREALALPREQLRKLSVRLGHVGDLRLCADGFGRLAGRGHPRQARGAVSRARLAALHAHDGKAGRGGDHARP